MYPHRFAVASVALWFAFVVVGAAVIVGLSLRPGRTVVVPTRLQPIRNATFPNLIEPHFAGEAYSTFDGRPMGIIRPAANFRTRGRGPAGRP